MNRLRQEDPTRRHAFVTMVLAALAALVVLGMDDPSQRKLQEGKAPGIASDKSGPLARHPGYRQRAAPVQVLIRPAVMDSVEPGMFDKKWHESGAAIEVSN